VITYSLNYLKPQIEELPKTPTDLSQYSWHKALSYYGHNNDQEEEEEEDESSQVISGLVSSVVIPRLIKLVETSYDPLSFKQTEAGIKLVDEISYCVEKTSPKFEQLIESFLSKLRLEIFNCQTLLLSQDLIDNNQLKVPSFIQFDPENFRARNRFLETRFKFLKICLKWRRFMKSLRIQTITLDDNDSGVQDPEKEVEVVLLEGGGNGGGESFDELISRELIAKLMLPLIELDVPGGGNGREIGKKVLDFLPKDFNLVPNALKKRLQG